MGNYFSRGFDPDKDLGDLSGRVYLVTGGNAGMGFAAVRHLARHGATVYMGARDERKANAALARLRGEGLERVEWLRLDLSDPRLAREAAQEFMRREKRLDVLVNNAALMVVNPAKTHDGVEDVVMVNHISTFVFTRTLLPLLTKTAQEPGSDVRIVYISSEAHTFIKPKDGVRFRTVDDLNRDYKDHTFPNFRRYGASKLMTNLTVHELQRRLARAHAPIIVTAANPGGVNTDGVQAQAPLLAGAFLAPLYSFLLRALLPDAEKGAYVHVFAAAAPVVRAESARYEGAYLQPSGKLGRASELSGSEELARELWDTTERFLAGLGIELPPIEGEDTH